MKKLITLVLLLTLQGGWAQDSNGVGEAVDASLDSTPNTINELITIVRDGTVARREMLAEREQRFIESRDQQAALLAEATRQREAEEAESDRLRALYEQGENDLAALEDLLQEQSGDLTEVFSVVSQVSGDALSLVQNSLVSAQIPDRLPLLEDLSDTQSIPTAAQLRDLWLLLLEEMNQSGQIARFEIPVITADGEEELQQVTRIGNFTAISEGNYLRFLPESGRLLALARQPLGVTAGAAQAFEAGSEPLVSVAVDPSRGAILSLIVQTPELLERVQQGGFIGYVILAIGAIGLLIGMHRLVMVAIATHRARHAKSHETSGGGHAIDQLREVARNKDYLADVDAMSAKMDEIVTTAAQNLRRGLATLAIFAAVSPLLGLLGTVTGMIETFQVITLFGAGDPRLMSGGISQALVTTQLGLSVAIPLLLIHSFIQGRANNLITELDEIAADMFAEGRAADVS